MHQDLIPVRSRNDAQTREYELSLLMMQLAVLRRSISRLVNLQSIINGCLTDLSHLINTLESAQIFLERFYNAMDAEDVGGFHETSDEE